MPTLRTFVVEDNALVLESLCAALVEIAFVDIVGTADCSQDALAWVSQPANTCDVLLVDLYLRVGSGVDVLKGVALLSRRPALTVVMSNYASRDMRRQCITLGADAIFDKSNELEEMLNWFNRAASSLKGPPGDHLGDRQA